MGSRKAQRLGCRALLHHHGQIAEEPPGSFPTTLPEYTSPTAEGSGTLPWWGSRTQVASEVPLLWVTWPRFMGP